MNSNGQLLAAIERITLELDELSLPDESRELVELVVQQQQLLEAYVRCSLPKTIDRELIHRVMAAHQNLKHRTQVAHGEASKELEALTQGRSASSAYTNVEERQYAD